MTINTINNGDGGFATRTKLNQVVAKINGVADGATANATDAQLRDRTTHTGEQAISTVTGLQTALDSKTPKVSSATDNALPRFDGTAGLLQSSGVTIDDTNNIKGAASIQLTGGSGVEGTMSWNDGDGTIDIALAGGQSVLQVGQEQLVRILNNTGSTLTDRQVVYITGAQGQRPTVALADADSESASSATIGVVTETIANGDEGFVTISGVVRNINTSTWAEGAQLYLSSIAGSLTDVKPSPPAHAVRIGWVVRQHATSGSILVHVQNGYELDELHDVLLSAVADGQMMVYDAASGLWKNTPNLTWKENSKELTALGKISVGTASNSQNVEFAVFKNGVRIDSSVQETKTGTGGDVQSTALHVVASLATNDYLEVYCRNLSTASNVTVKNLNFFAMNAN